MKTIAEYPYPVNEYLETLRLIPDDIILSMATREFMMYEPGTCVCGWAIRESIARATNKSADVVPVDYSPDVIWDCTHTFGGSSGDWSNIFYGVCSPERAALIETAFVDRVQECL